MSTALSDGRQRRARSGAVWLGLAAAPTFLLMASITATDSAGVTVCSPASGLLQFNGMAWMYGLMGVFHLAPWLKLAGR